VAVKKYDTSFYILHCKDIKITVHSHFDLFLSLLPQYTVKIFLIICTVLISLHTSF
jgi:hypothetical protein